MISAAKVVEEPNLDGQLNCFLRLQKSNCGNGAKTRAMTQPGEAVGQAGCSAFKCLMGAQISGKVIEVTFYLGNVGSI